MSMAAKNGSEPGQPLGDAPEVAVLSGAHSASGCPCCSWGVQLRSPGPTGEILHCLNTLTWPAEASKQWEQLQNCEQEECAASWPARPT